MEKTIFIGYNSSPEVEKNTALRLQTISNLYGLNILLPSRLSLRNESINSETKHRINESMFVLAFCIENISDLLKAELLYAMSVNKPIILLYDKEKGKQIDFSTYSNLQEVYIDFYNTEEASHQIAAFLLKCFQPQASNEANKIDIGLAIAFIGIVVGLLAFWALSYNKED